MFLLTGSFGSNPALFKGNVGPNSHRFEIQKKLHIFPISICPSRFVNTCSINLVDGTSVAQLKSSVPNESLHCPSAWVEGKMRAQNFSAGFKETIMKVAVALRSRSSE